MYQFFYSRSSRFRLFRYVILFSLLCAHGVDAASSVYTRFFSDTALNGYDAVAYFKQGKAVKGDKQHQVRYMEADWHFSSAENLQLFKNNPEKFAPQYGGHCAWAVAEKDKKVAGDPEVWKIVDGKLYINYNDAVQETWEKDIPGHIKKADVNWPGLETD